MALAPQNKEIVFLFVLQQYGYHKKNKKTLKKTTFFSFTTVWFSQKNDQKNHVFGPK